MFSKSSNTPTEHGWFVFLHLMLCSVVADVVSFAVCWLLLIVSCSLFVICLLMLLLFVVVLVLDVVVAVVVLDADLVVIGCC